MKNVILSFAILFGTWLLLSGVYKTLMIAFGLFSVILTIFFVRRMDKFDRYQVKFDIRFFKFIVYFIWLLGEIAKSNIQVIKTILQGDKNINQKMFYKKTTQESDIGKVIFAIFLCFGIWEFQPLYKVINDSGTIIIAKIIWVNKIK